MQQKIQNLSDLISQLGPLFTKVVKIDEQERTVALKEGHFLRNLIEAYYTLRGYQVKYI